MFRKFKVLEKIIFFLIIALGILNFRAKPPHVLFMITGGSHYNPTLPLVESLLNQGTKVTYLSDDPTNKAFSQLKTMGARVYCYEELFKDLWIKEGKTELAEQPWNHFGSNEIDQPEGVQASEILNQYLTAKYWNEFLSITQSISPDIIVYDSNNGGWGKYIGAYLNIPAFASWASAFVPQWLDPHWLEIETEYYQKKYPPTEKRIWATQFLCNILGVELSKKLDLHVNRPLALSLPEYGTIAYTYPELEGYNGQNYINTNLYCVAHSIQQINESRKKINLSENDQTIFDECKSLKEVGGKKLIFISMGTDSSKPMIFFELLAEALGDYGNSENENHNLLVALHPGYKIARQEKYKASDIAQLLQDLGHSNFIVKDYFPLPKLFEIVDVFVGHGGKNSTMEAMMFQIPTIIMPIHGDQLIMASRIQEWEMGFAIPHDLNIIANSDNNDKWNEIAQNQVLRCSFVNWLKDHVWQLIREQSTDAFKEKEENLKAKFSGALSYDDMASIILSTKKSS